ncbi:HlyD family efflux transporter periplasmic adaptor subunit [Naumannella halotolerans]|uniref:HlyD family secretion protein n=1 Tax=Naumannella halotolerans TaxID=993414 RepID=A0A4R7J9S4_9ACTN|nr:HlyD family efflux transporter periplasmic adaptor subunit [Naumannella halotolerans]TDT34054.1 HlyD family secretion protein [Naumannella halotolerans]
MTWRSRFRLLGTLILTLVISAALVLVFNQRQNQLASFSGEVVADRYVVGADHGGTVVEQWVRAGDQVQQGDRLFAVQSLQLLQDIENGLMVTDNDAYTVDTETGTLTYRAVVDGTVTEINAQKGNSLAFGQPLAELTVDQRRRVQAKFHLTAREYGRLSIGSPARVTLPDNSIIDGQVQAVSVSTDETGTTSTVVVESRRLNTVEPASLTAPGTPVMVTIDLVDTGPLAGVNDLWLDFLHQVGLR